MGIKKLTDETIDTLLTEAFQRKRPQTQDECCAVAAHIAVLADDGPWTDDHIIDAASDMARGLFGPAFEAADYGQRSAWVDMCEREIRKAIV